jgi:hypothetical protein
MPFILIHNKQVHICARAELALLAAPTLFHSRGLNTSLPFSQEKLFLKKRRLGSRMSSGCMRSSGGRKELSWRRTAISVLGMRSSIGAREQVVRQKLRRRWRRDQRASCSVSPGLRSPRWRIREHLDLNRKKEIGSYPLAFL